MVTRPRPIQPLYRDMIIILYRHQIFILLCSKHLHFGDFLLVTRKVCLCSELCSNERPNATLNEPEERSGAPVFAPLTKNYINYKMDQCSQFLNITIQVRFDTVWYIDANNIPELGWVKKQTVSRNHRHSPWLTPSPTPFVVYSALSQWSRRWYFSYVLRQISPLVESNCHQRTFSSGSWRDRIKLGSGCRIVKSFSSARRWHDHSICPGQLW